MFFKLFNWLVKRLPYSLAVMIFSFIFSALMVVFFVWFFLVAGNFETTGTDEIIIYITLGITSFIFLLCVLEYGYGFYFGLGGKRFKILNENIINGHISSNVSNQTLLEVYDALNKINKWILTRHIQYVYFLFSSTALAEWLVSKQTTNVPVILISGLIWGTIAFISGMAYELFTLPARRECKILLSSRGIHFKKPYFLSLNIKSNFFIILTALNLGAILFIFHPLNPILIISSITVLIPISFLTKLVFETIYKAFMEINELAEGLPKSKTTSFFTGSLDKEIINLSQSLNETAREISNYQRALEEERASLEIKVKERTKELDAANQQLRASEQQLKAANQQLIAAQKQLQEKVKKIDKSRSILYSLAEDIQKEKEKVEEAKKALDIKVIARTRQLSEEHGKLQSLIESVKLGVVLVDLSMNVILANSAVKAILGKFPGEPLTFEDLDKKFKQVNLRRVISDYIKRKKGTRIIETMLNEKHFRLFLAPVIEITEKTIIGAAIVIEDITEEKLLDRMRTEIVSITSHQLRTPLSVIKGNLEMVLGGDVGEITKDQKEILEETFLGNERMIKLVNDLMDVSKITEGKLGLELKPAKLEDLVAENVKEILPFTQKKQVSLLYSPPPEPLPKVNVDPQRIKQVILNLIDNAIRYSKVDAKGKVVVEIQKSDKFLKTIVKDNGAGIPKLEQSKIFERFFRASNITQVDPGGGTGLGLFIAKAIIEQSGGKIWFESEGEGKGTTFYFTLPYK